MPLVLITDTDVAAVPFGKGKPYSFKLDAQNKGPFAGMVPLSHVLDPAKEQAVVDSLAGQFANIPYADVCDAFLAEHGLPHPGGRGQRGLLRAEWRAAAIRLPDGAALAHTQR